MSQNTLDGLIAANASRVSPAQVLGAMLNIQANQPSPLTACPDGEPEPCMANPLRMISYK